MNECQPHDAFENFRKLQTSVNHGTAPIVAADGTILSDNISKLNRWKEHFDAMLNRPLTTGSVQITMAAANATEDASIQTDIPDLQEITKAISKSKNGKAPHESATFRLRLLNQPVLQWQRVSGSVGVDL